MIKICIQIFLYYILSLRNKIKYIILYVTQEKLNIKFFSHLKDHSLKNKEINIDALIFENFIGSRSFEFYDKMDVKK